MAKEILIPIDSISKKRNSGVCIGIDSMFFYLKLWKSKWSHCLNRIERRVSAVNAADWLVETHSGREREITRLRDLFFFRSVV